MRSIGVAVVAARRVNCTSSTQSANLRPSLYHGAYHILDSRPLLPCDVTHLFVILAYGRWVDSDGVSLARLSHARVHLLQFGGGDIIMLPPLTDDRVELHGSSALYWIWIEWTFARPPAELIVPPDLKFLGVLGGLKSFSAPISFRPFNWRWYYKLHDNSAQYLEGVIVVFRMVPHYPLELSNYDL